MPENRGERGEKLWPARFGRRGNAERVMARNVTPV